MKDEWFHVHIEDADGQIIMDEEVQALGSGFIDFWLPRDETFTVTIEHDGNVTEKEISSFEGDNTCITTMQF